MAIRESYHGLIQGAKSPSRLPAQGSQLQGDDLAATIDRLRTDIDALLLDLLPVLPGAPGRLGEAMRYAVVGGGKRFRALLTVAVAEMVGASYDHALRVGAAIECVHAQSLVHDDLPCMDDDDVRRGRPSVHRYYDEATAVLAGDALLALAFEILAEGATHPDANIRVALISKLTKSIGHAGLAAGQMMDLYPVEEPTFSDLVDCEKRKTGGLIRYAIEAGAMLGAYRPEQMASLLRFSDCLGLAFQLRDNLLDLEGDAQTVGKNLRKDKAAGRKNTVTMFGARRAQEQIEDLAHRCRQELAAFGAQADMLNRLAEFAIFRSF